MGRTRRISRMFKKTLRYYWIAAKGITGCIPGIARTFAGGLRRLWGRRRGG